MTSFRVAKQVPATILLEFRPKRTICSLGILRPIKKFTKHSTEYHNEPAGIIKVFFPLNLNQERLASMFSKSSASSAKLLSPALYRRCYRTKHKSCAGWPGTAETSLNSKHFWARNATVYTFMQQPYDRPR
ncbi:hypothetical protein TSAR_009995 [Trichomalopsis sarcophagae]|uniref:Uncharacterized protein n=1 Tax=Trichomalopsis sarcophagae TaxID=543379 RepID=A0A232FAU3_9HYME|nr:hypothetical protein TSAR_009995 [Trichomalopsis sarcophagae]